MKKILQTGSFVPKNFRVCKWATFLFCLTCQLCAFSSTMAQERVTLNLKEASMKELFAEIRKQTSFSFVYSDDQMGKLTPVTIRVNGETVENVLDNVFKSTPYTYTVEGKSIAIVARDKKENMASPVLNLRGSVKDNKGIPMPGVTVIVKGTKLGRATDMSGRFNIELPGLKEVTLVFSFIGMETKEVVITDPEILSGKKDCAVVLVEITESLDDVVVTGYANVRKESYTGNAVRVEGKDLMKVGSRNVISALQVFDPSFRIMENNAMGSDPNSIPEFYIRGQSGIGVRELDATDVSEAKLKNNSNLPIFILDGLDVSVEKIYDMDPSRIHSITILKDAAATAVYGSRASNGVIVVETIAPKAGKFNVSYNLTGSITTPDLSSYNYFNAKEKLEAELLAGYYDLDPTQSGQDVRNVYSEYIKKLNAINKGVDTDWLSQPLRTGYNHKHSVTLDGGNDNIRYGINLRYDNQNGVMKKDFRNRMGVELRVDYRLEKLNVVNQVSFNKIMYQNSPFGVFSNFVEQQPYNEMKDEFGHYLYSFPYWHSGAPYINPMYEGTETKNYSKGNSEEFSDNLLVDYYINDNLRVKGQLGVTLTTNENRVFYDPKSGRFSKLKEGELAGSLSTIDGRSFRWTTNLQLLYNRSLGQNHISASLGFNSTESFSSTRGAKYQGFPSGGLSSIMYAQEQVGKSSETDNHTRLAGCFARLNYSYDDIYLFDGSLRMDGSSEFGSDKKFAPFWSAGAGLNIHNYAFLKDHPVLSQLKLTATFGQTGKLNFQPYAAKDIYQIFSEDWYATGMGVRLMALGNESLTWEKKNSYDLKAEVSIKNGLLYVKGAYYYAMTKDMITEITIPSSFGFTSYYDNLGKIRNIGYELEVRSNVINKPDLYLNVFWNLSSNKNKIMKIANSLRDYNDQVNKYYDGYAEHTAHDPKYAKPFMKYEEGGSTTSIFGMKSLGIDPASGQEVYERKDGSITYKWEAKEQQILGNKLPDAQGSFGLNLQWKSLSVFMSFLYEFGGQEYNETIPNRIESVDIYNVNADKRVLTDRWIKIGDLTPLKDIADKGLFGKGSYSRPTSRFVQNKNVLNFNSLSIGWTFKDGWVSRLKLSQVKLQFNTKDLAYWSTIERERGTSYPFARTFDFTLGVSF